MELKIKIKPHYVKANTKEELMAKIHGCGRYVFIVGSIKGIDYVGLSTFRDQHLRVYNIQKHRRKTKHDKNKNTVVIKPSYWDGYIYDIPLDILPYVGLNIKQQKRNFKFYK